MKTFTTLLIFIFAIGIETQAQKIYFSDTSNKWTVFEMDGPPAPDPSHFEGHNFYENTGTVSYKGHIWTQLKKTADLFFSQLYIDSALVRDDITANKVFAIVYPDTNEVVLYDYNLQIGDTFKMSNSSGNYEHVVTQIDSTTINNISHRIFKLMGINAAYDYWIIEGIGSTASPLHPSLPVIPILSQHSWFLSCFSNSSIQSQLSSNPTNFINTSNGCTLSTNDIDIKNSEIVVSPQPAFLNAVIKLPYLFKEGNVSITNKLGQKIYQSTFTQKQDLIIPHPGIHGMFMYHISEKSTGKTYSGRIVFE